MHLGNIEAAAGEVWMVDFGTAAKRRPVVVLAFPQPADARALVVAAPLTSQIRNLRGEVPIGRPKWLPKVSAVNVQGLASIHPGALERRLGRLAPAQMEAVRAAVRDLLGL